MKTVKRVTTAPIEAVWAVLADGWTYPGWVVGASRIRDVSDCWPEQGSLLHHSVGLWPLLVDDETEVVEVIEGRAIRMRAKTRPLGQAFIEIRLRPHGAGTQVEMEEEVTHGPGLALPAWLRQRLFVVRNREVLHRLCLMAERRVA